MFHIHKLKRGEIIRFHEGTTHIQAQCDRRSLRSKHTYYAINLHDHFMHFCDKFWGSSTFWPSTTWITSKLSRPNLNSLIHLASVEYERAESLNVFWKLAWISFVFIPFFMKYLITAWISAFSFVTNQYAETTKKSRRYHCPTARALTHVFTHKGCVIIAWEPRTSTNI